MPAGPMQAKSPNQALAALHMNLFTEQDILRFVDLGGQVV